MARRKRAVLIAGPTASGKSALALAAARERGGTVVNEPQDTPYGRIATVRDPFGTEFHLMKPADM